MKQWLTNPFRHIAGGKALLIGWCAIIITILISFFSHAHFDGAIDMHVGRAAPIAVFFMEQLTDWLCIVFLFYAAGKVLSRSAIRFIDVAGTMALARCPLVFVAIIAFGIAVPQHGQTVESVIKGITPLFIILSLATVLSMIWMVALMYNAFTTSCNIKGGKAIAIFAEIASHIILHQVYTHIN